MSSKNDKFKVAIKKWRDSKGYTQEEAANALSLPLWTLRGYEQGKRAPRNGSRRRAIAGLSTGLRDALGITA